MKLSTRFSLILLLLVAIQTLFMLGMALSFKKAENLSSKINTRLLPSFKVLQGISLQLQNQLELLRHASSGLDNALIAKTKAQFEAYSELNKKQIQWLKEFPINNSLANNLEVCLAQIADAGARFFKRSNLSNPQEDDRFFRQTLKSLAEKKERTLKPAQKQLEEEIEAISSQVQKQFQINSPKMLSLYLFSLFGVLGALAIAWSSTKSDFNKIKLALKKALNGDLIGEQKNKYEGEMREIMTAHSLLMHSLKKRCDAIASSPLLNSEMLEATDTFFRKMNQQTGNINQYAIECLAKNSNLHSYIQNLAATSNEISKNAECVSMVIETLNNTVGESLQQCEFCNKNVSQAQDYGNKVTQEVKLLERSIDEILIFIKTVNGIAEQTNMLALNATIEASSIHEEGKGFNVVANEVKELAKKSTQISNQIKTQTDQIQKNIQNTTGTISSIVHIVNDLSSTLKTITHKIKEKENAATDVLKNALQLTHFTKLLEESIKESLDTSAEISRNIQSLEQECQSCETHSKKLEEGMGSLAQSAIVLKHSINNFLP